MTHYLITTLIALSLYLPHAYAESTGVSLNQAQSQFPTIYLPSVGSVNRNRFKLPDEAPNAPKLRVKAFEFTGVKSINVEELYSALPLMKIDFSPRNSCWR